MALRSVYILGCGVMLAGIVHIVAILLIPTLGSKDAARQIIESQPELEFTQLDSVGEFKLGIPDPYFELAVCRFTLEENGVFIFADRVSAFWSAAIYDDRGKVLYSLNERTAIGNKLQLLIVNPIQMASIRQLQPDELETSIVVETGISEGFVLLRSLVRDQSLQEQSRNFIKSARCENFQPNAAS